MIYIEKITAFAHLQDLGRFGFRNFGIGSVGAMDALALQAGNLLLHNPPNTAAIEIALGGLTITFDCATPFCLTGALCEATLDNTPIYSYWRYTAKAGQRLTIKRLTMGNYAYFCVAGGFILPQVLNSYSTDLNAGFGGYRGRFLQAGDTLATAQRDSYLSSLGIQPIAFTTQIYLTASSEFAAFSADSQQRLTAQAWKLAPTSNRMGYRFDGKLPLQLTAPLEMLSYAAPVGTVQVPPDGKPIILMADAQTTGGYPKIACVIQADIGRLAQIPFGNEVHFQLISHQQAKHLYQKDQSYLDNIRRTINETR